jgi:hypothetical protein
LLERRGRCWINIMPVALDRSLSLAVPYSLPCSLEKKTVMQVELKCRGRFSSPTLLLLVLRRLPSPFDGARVCKSGRPGPARQKWDSGNGIWKTGNRIRKSGIRNFPNPSLCPFVHSENGIRKTRFVKRDSEKQDSENGIRKNGI